MFVPVRDRPSVAEPTEAQDRPVMETKSAAIHRKMPMPARQLPITGFAHKARVVGDAHMGAVLASLDMAAERFGATNLDRRHDATLGEIQMPLVGRAPTGSVAAEHIRHLKIRRRHRRLVRATKASLYSGVRAGFEPVEWC